MKLARVQTAGGPVVALVEGQEAFAALADGRGFDDLPALLEAVAGDPARLRPGEALGELSSLRLLAPVARPRKIICIGLNYRRHAAEVGMELPPAPPLFAKWDNAIVGPYDPVPLPPGCDTVDFEAELAFVIARRCRRVPAAEAGGVLLGYCCANDVSERRYQSQTSQWTAGKAFDGFCPLGPWIVTVDELGPNPDLAIRGRLDGQVMQESRTNDLIFTVPQLVEFISFIMTLEPGDIVLTGTPEGVGVARRPRRFIQPGETYEVEIEGIGAIRNRFVAE